MTTLYRPVLIETAEQAEALPEGTLATHPGHWPMEKYETAWQSRDEAWGGKDVIGWTALEPVEAEEGDAVTVSPRGVVVVYQDGGTILTDHPHYLAPIPDAPAE